MGSAQDGSGGLSSKCVDAILANQKAQAKLSSAQAARDAARKALDAAKAAALEVSGDWADDSLCVIETLTPWGAAACLTQHLRSADHADDLVRAAEKEFWSALELADEAEREDRDAESRVRRDCERSDAGCGSRGGRGCRRPDGKCAGWDDWGYEASDEAYV
jgi:hypothetical protein